MSDTKYVQNLGFELDGHGLRHRFEFVDELDACVSSDGHHSQLLLVFLLFRGLRLFDPIR